MAVVTHMRKGYLLTWVGRRSHVKEDILQYRGTNFCGHTLLVVRTQEKKQCICFGPDLSNDNDPNTDMNIFYHHVQNKNRKWLEKWNLPASINVSSLDECETLKNALEANLNIYVTPTYYNHSKLEKMIDDRKFLQGIRYAWNVDVEKGHLNCNTFLQVWGIIPSIPLIKKQSDFQNMLLEKYNAQSLLKYMPIAKEIYRMNPFIDQAKTGK